MPVSHDELYRFSVIRKTSDNAKKKAVTLPPPDQGGLNIGSEDNEWGFDRVPNRGFVEELINDYMEKPPSRVAMRDLARRLDMPTDETAWHLLARHIVGSEPFKKTQGGVSALIRIGLANRPHADEALVPLTQAAVSLDTLVVLAIEDLEDGPSAERWVQLVNRPLLRPGAGKSSHPERSPATDGQESEIVALGETLTAINRMVAEGTADDNVIANLPMADVVRASLQRAGSQAGGLRNAQSILIGRARHLAERQGSAAPAMSDRQVNPGGNSMFSMYMPVNSGNRFDDAVLDAMRDRTDPMAGLRGTGLDRAADILREARRVPSKIQPIGRQDLLVVRTRQLGYRLADISHIENVAAAEAKSRVHELEIEKEESFESETLVESSSLSDLTTTTRDELRSQIQAEQERSISLEGRIRATYRGPVTVEAEASASMNQRRARSSDVVRNHAVTVVERAVNSVREMSQERVSRKLRTLMKERNTHEFVADDKNKALIYQWVKRVDRAAVFNYGERQMYDFVLPAPSANLRKLSQQAPPEATVRRPPPDAVFEALQSAVRADGLSAVDTFLNDGSISAAFEIGEPPPQPEGQWVSVEISNVTASEPKPNSNWFAASQELQVPFGTRGTRLRVGYHTFSEGHDVIPRISVVLGETHMWARHDTLDRDQSKRETQSQLVHAQQFEVWTKNINQGDTPAFSLPKMTIGGNEAQAPGAVMVQFAADTGEHPGDIAIEPLEPGSHKASLVIDDYSVFASNISIYCEPTEETVNSWRNTVLAAVISDYWRQKEAFAQQQLMSQPDADPLENLSDAQSAELREIEMAEIKNAAIGILRGHDPVGITAESNAKWYRDHQAHADEILFVEQAFEWEHLQFTLYPYYWSAPGARPGLLFGMRGGDRQFREFLKAGAARVQIPVRPGFEEDVEAYINDGMVWSGKARPRIGSPQYVDMLTERMADLGAPGNESPVLGPDGLPVYWDFSTPTDLVILRSWEGDDSNAPFSRYVPPEEVGPDDDPLKGWSFGSGAVPDSPADV